MNRAFCRVLMVIAAVFAVADATGYAATTAPAKEGITNATGTKCNNFTFDGTKSTALGKGKLTYLWDFGDGSTSTSPIVQHMYAKGGEYRVTLTVTDESGTPCNKDMAPLTIRVNMAPNVTFTGPDAVCAGSEAMFDASGTTTDTARKLTYTWDFGDGTKGDGVKAAHTYTKGGNYQVQLTVNDDLKTECSVACASKCVKINSVPVADAGKDIRMCSLTAKDEYKVDFNGTGTDPDGDALSYAWDFGDGTKGTGSDVSHVYAKGGAYTATLMVNDSLNTACSGASDTVSVKLMKGAVAVASSGKKGVISVCSGDTVELDGSSSYVEPGQTGDYTWDLGDGTTAKGVKVSHKYEKGGKYWATLRVSDGRACEEGGTVLTSSDSVGVFVNNIPTAVLAKPDGVCVGNLGVFDGSGSHDPDGDALVYSWDFGDGTVLEGNAKESHRYQKGGAYKVTLMVDDGMGTACSKSSTSADIRVNTAPISKVGVLTICCVGLPGIYNGLASSDPDGDKLSYFWDFGDGATATGATPEHTYTKPGTYKITFRVDDNTGTPCSTSYSCYEADIHENPTAVPTIR
ncbi:MAG: PKD domain-containing protein [Candidatus Omnitrophica bacterium]|nr:PKD domain-containing protein [Candidatus Omnitrophota bacterium]